MEESPTILRPTIGLITWEDCLDSRFDHFCQELWIDSLYRPRTKRRLPWLPESQNPDLCEIQTRYARYGMVSVWVLLSVHARDYFDYEEYRCETDPLDAPLFWDDLGFMFEPHDARLCTKDRLTPLSSLIEEYAVTNEYGHSEIPFLASYGDALQHACQAMSVTEAAGFYCGYDVAYDGEPVFGRFCCGLVRFAGAFRYRRSI